MEKKCIKAKWLSGESLQIAVKRKEAKSKGEKERYKHLNAEFQRIARRDKKAFFSNHCKEIEENNRMGKTRDLFKKIGDTKGTAWYVTCLLFQSPIFAFCCLSSVSTLQVFQTDSNPIAVGRLLSQGANQWRLRFPLRQN